LPPLLAGRGATRSNDDDLTCCAAYGRYGAGDQQLVSSRSEPPSPAATARWEGFFLPENAAAADTSGMSRGWYVRSLLYYASYCTYVLELRSLQN
jgi:hypothetical protein